MHKFSNEFVSPPFGPYGRNFCGFLNRRVKFLQFEYVTQQTCLLLLEHPNPDELRNPRAYLFKTVSNLAVDHMGRRRVHVDRLSSDVETETLSSSDPHPDRVAEATRRIPAPWSAPSVMRRHGRATSASLKAEP